MKTCFAVAAALALLILSVPTGLDSCAIGPPSPVFSTGRRPANIEGEFLKGKAGVVRGSWQRRHLLAAYRILSGAPLTAAEAASLYPKPSAAAAPEASSNPVQEWLKARNAIRTESQAPWLNTFKSEKTAGEFAYYQNCLDAAFDSARQTLAERVARWGAADPRTVAWAKAQDQVFANCSGDKPAIPDPPTPGADPLLAADRAYQIAAAYFYAGDWPKAREALQNIAADAASPWHGIAPYVAARTYIREGTIRDKPEALREAESRLTAIAHDPARPEWHESAARLLDYVSTRLNPNTRVSELAAALIKPDASKDFGQSAADLLFLYNRNIGSEAVMQSTELTSWLVTIEQGSAENQSRAVDRWTKTTNPAWLVAALEAAGDRDLPALLRAAHETPPDAPSYESVTWAGIEKEIQSGHKDQARQWADQALASDLLLSTRNLVLSARLRLARDFTEFLRFAPRRPEPKLENFDGSELDADRPPGVTDDAPLFDEDAAKVFNLSLPLSLWISASESPLLPKRVQLQIAQAAWVRAILLGRDAEAGKLMERIGAPAGSLPLLVMLRAPSLTPELASGSGNLVDLAKTDRSGAGRWGFGGSCWGSTTVPLKQEFLTPEQSAEAEKDFKALIASAPIGANWMAQHAVEWANANRDDPRVPEVLHLAVQSSRRGCKDEQTGAYSKQAFDLLHQRYPKSEWTALTKYWYK